MTAPPPPRPRPDPAWGAVEDWFDRQLLGDDEALSAAQEASRNGGLPDISIFPAQGAFLQILAASIGARRILEVGTLGGYSTIWLARALPSDGLLVSCEIDPHHAEVAGNSVARAGLGALVDIKVGPAVDTLERLAEDHAAGRLQPFDLAFIDADKESNADYVALALRLCRPRGVIVVDNVVRRGEILAEDPDSAAIGVRQLVDFVAAEPRLTATVLQTVGPKGWDGMLIARIA